MSDFLEFSCPACGRVQIFSTAGVAREGAWGSCSGCGEEVFVTPDGTEVRSASETREAGQASEPSAPEEWKPPEAGPPISAAPEGLYHVRLATGKVEQLSVEALEHGVQAGRITPWDLVSEDGSHFDSASRDPTLRQLFLDRDFMVRLQPKCVNHLDRLPAGTCQRCGRSFCGECVERFQRPQSRHCVACGATLHDPDPRLTEIPPWKRVKEVALYPIAANAWVLTLSLAILTWLAGRSTATLPLHLVVLAALLWILSRSSKGDRHLGVGARPDLAELGRLVLPTLVLTFVIAIPFVMLQQLFGYGSSIGTILLFPLGLATIAYYPMAIGRLLLKDDKQKALQPKGVIAAIVALKEEYLTCLAILLVAGVTVFGLQTIVGLVPFLGQLLGGVVRAYGLVLMAYLLGWTLYMNRERIAAAG